MSSLAIPVTVALVDETGTISSDELTDVAGALGEQVAQDLEPIWHVRANVIATSKPGPFQWAVKIREQLDEPGALGYHTDSHHVPVSYVELTDGWTVTVSHETLEMLVDPWGSRVHSARVPQGINYRDVGLKHESSYVHWLIEACDPCERTVYKVQGIELSDFLLPAYYRSTPAAPGNRYSFTGSLSQPREVDDGGYVSFARSDGTWFQVMNRHGQLRLENIGRFDSKEFSTLRAFSDYYARLARNA